MKVAALALAALMVGSIAMAADTEAGGAAKTETSTNPITGTETTETKAEAKSKDAAGNTHKVKKVKKVKKHTDGSTETSTESHDSMGK